MVDDEEFAHRVRELLAEEDDVTEKAMFARLAFLGGGHMAAPTRGRSTRPAGR
jgi:hypothetical protein